MYDGQTKRERRTKREIERVLKVSDENHSLTFTIQTLWRMDTNTVFKFKQTSPCS